MRNSISTPRKQTAKGSLFLFKRDCLAGNFGQWSPLPRAFVRAFGAEQAAVIASLVNAFAHSADNEGFAEATERYIRNGLGKGVEPILADLANEGFLEIELRGEQDTRYIRINVEKLRETIAEQGYSDEL